MFHRYTTSTATPVTDARSALTEHLSVCPDTGPQVTPARASRGTSHASAYDDAIDTVSVESPSGNPNG